MTEIDATTSGAGASGMEAVSVAAVVMGDLRFIEAANGVTTAEGKAICLEAAFDCGNDEEVARSPRGYRYPSRTHILAFGILATVSRCFSRMAAHPPPQEVYMLNAFDPNQKTRFH